MTTKPGMMVTYDKELSFIKSRQSYHVVCLANLVSLILFVGLERKRLNCHQVLVYFAFDSYEKLPVVF